MSGCSTITIRGTGTARREFLYVDDLADAYLVLMERYDDDLRINMGVGKDVGVTELAEFVAGVVGLRGELRYDRTKPDGTPRKPLNVSRIKWLGWLPRISLRQAAEPYRWSVSSRGSESGG